MGPLPLGFLASLLLAAGGAVAGERSAPVVLGLLLPPDEPQAVSIRQGVRIAVEEANEAGTSGVRVVERGKKGAWGSDASEAALLVMDDGAQALLAPTGGAATHLVLQVSGRTALPVASLCPDTSVTRASIPWMVRVAPSTSDEAKAVFDGLPASTWLAFVPVGRAGREVASDLKSAAAAAATGLGPTPSISKVVETGDGTIPEAALRETLAGARPGAILIWLPPVEAGRLCRSLRTAGFKGPIAGPSSLGSRLFAAEAGASAERVVVPSIEANGAGAAFDSRYRRSFGGEPDQTAALAHDAALLLVRAARRADPAASPLPLSAGEPLQGATGSLAFDRHGNRLLRLRLVRYQGGRLAPL